MFKETYYTKDILVFINGAVACILTTAAKLILVTYI